MTSNHLSLEAMMITFAEACFKAASCTEDHPTPGTADYDTWEEEDGPCWECGDFSDYVSENPALAVVWEDYV